MPRTKTLASFLCATLALTACTSDGPLTATDALGDLKSIDYCSVVGKSGESDYERCRISNGVKLMAVGPLLSGESKDLHPVEYHGSALPDGMRIQGSTANAQQSCTRFLTFSDDIRLSFVVTGESKADANCAKAMEVVEEALKVIDDGKVAHRQFADNSFARLDPCTLLTTPEVTAAIGAGANPKPGVNGHNCLLGDVSLSFDVKRGILGDPETIAGSETTVNKIGQSCTVHVDTETESADIKATNPEGDADDSTCDQARTVAALVLPALPKS